MRSTNIINNILGALNLNLNELKNGADDSPFNCAVISSGCKLNQVESSQFKEIFKCLNINIVEPDLTLKNNEFSGTCSETPEIKKNSRNNIDFFLLNTCSVTAKADSFTNKIIRKIQKNYPGCKLILTGCSAELNKKQYSSLSGIKLIDNTLKAELLKSVGESIPATLLNQKRVRPYLKIQEGCDTECSFCVIPKARPVKWSLNSKDVISAIMEFNRLGCKEIILTGVNIGSYNGSEERAVEDKGKNGRGFKELLKRIEELNIAVKIRISSIDPVYIDDEFIEIAANSNKIQNHFHIPLQSASDKILKLMNRHYNFEDYKLIINKLTEKIKDVAIGTDIISGFPFETEDDFLETAYNLSILPFYYIHAFSYSDRQGTASYLIKPKVNGKIIKQRTNKIMEISLQKKIAYHLKFINRPLEFLSLPNNKAISSNYIRGDLNKNDSIIPAGTLFQGKITESKNLYEKDEVIIKLEHFI